jgi:hypothetical protein
MTFSALRAPAHAIDFTALIQAMHNTGAARVANFNPRAFQH